MRRATHAATVLQMQPQLYTHHAMPSLQRGNLGRTCAPPSPRVTYLGPFFYYYYHYYYFLMLLQRTWRLLSCALHCVSDLFPCPDIDCIDGEEQARRRGSAAGLYQPVHCRQESNHRRGEIGLHHPSSTANSTPPHTDISIVGPRHFQCERVRAPCP